MIPVHPVPARPPWLGRAALAAVLPLLGVFTACGYGSQAPRDDAAPTAASAGETLSADEVTIGYFANITHGAAMVGLDQHGPIRQELGGTQADTQVFNAGPSAIEALNAGAVDLTFVGPNPAVNGYVQSGGQNLRIVAGAASGGAGLVVRPDRVSGLDDLEGKRIATPQLGNTQDVALLGYLAEQGYQVDAEQGNGDVTVLRIANQEIPAALENGSVDGAWVPQPTIAHLVNRGARMLLDEAELWENGQYVVTHLVASQKFLREHPDVVKAVVRGLVRSNAWIEENPDEAKELINTSLKELTTTALPPAVLDPAFEHVEFLNDPLAPTLKAGADRAVTAGLLREPDLAGIYDLSLLNEVLTDEGLPQISDDAGLSDP